MYHQVLHRNDCKFQGAVPKGHCSEVLPASGAQTANVPAWREVRRHHVAACTLFQHCVNAESSCLMLTAYSAHSSKVLYIHCSCIAL